MTALAPLESRHPRLGQSLWWLWVCVCVRVFGWVGEWLGVCACTGLVTRESCLQRRGGEYILHRWESPPFCRAMDGRMSFPWMPCHVSRERWVGHCLYAFRFVP